MELLIKAQKKLHDWLGWGFPASIDHQDDFQPTYHCKYCNQSLAQDSTGAYFHLSNKTTS